MTTPTNPPPTAPASAEPSLRHCPHCGEGVASFCRGKTADCKLGLPLPAASPQLAEGERAALLTDEQIDSIQEAAYRALVAKGYNGGMAGEQWDHASARAIERAVLDSQAAELAEAREMLAAHDAIRSGLEAELARLRASAASVQADQRDSLRYRIWREHFAGATSCEISGLMIALADSWTPEAVDAAIDAAAGKGEA